MKRILFLLLAESVFVTGQLYAQSLPNGDFEIWTEQFYFSEPTHFWTTNLQAFFSGAGANVTKTTDAKSGIYALRLESVAIDTNVIPGAIAIGNPGTMGFSGGYPYSELPDSISGFVKYDLSPGDIAVLFVVFSLGGTPVAVVGQSFTGEQASYTEFKAPIMSFLPEDPDTFQFFLSTSGDFESAVAGNIFYIDDLQFIGSTEPFPNGSFEEWMDFSSEDPDDWLTSNIVNYGAEPSVTKTLDAHSGEYAIRLENVPLISDTVGAFAILGQLSDEDPIGNFPLFDKPKIIRGFYKYSPVGTDSSLFFAKFTKWNPLTQQRDSIAEKAVSFLPTSIYNEFTIMFDFNWIDQPDTMLFGFSPSFLIDDSASITVGSVLIVDNLTIEFVSGVIFPIGKYLKWVEAYPNPVNEFVRLDFELTFPTPIKVEFFDESGRNIQHFNFGKRNGEVHLTLPVSRLVPGSYYYSIITDRGSFGGKFIVQ